MVRSFLPRAALLLVLILLLVTPVVQAAEPGTHKGPAPYRLPGLAAVFAEAWEFLTSVWANNGCRLDPDGLCVTGQENTAEADNGCRIDPNGGCAP